jgi:hypothetical protein
VDEDKRITNSLILEQTDDLQTMSFFDIFVTHVDENLLTIFPKAQEARVGDAIVALCKRKEHIDIFNKKALFIYIKEITDASTPTITKVIKVLKGIYKEMLNKYLEEGTEYNIFAK